MVKLALLLFIALASQKAWCFPEMVRYGYVNCSSCHISPSGGGVLNQYGRQLSKEVLSTWGNDGEEQFAYNVVKLPEWLNMMGQYRNVYAYQNTPFVQQGQFIFMQNDLEAAATYKKFFADLSLGYENLPTDTTLLNHVISRTSFLGYYLTDEISVRGGRFYPNVGIYAPDHTLFIKRDLGWDQGQETVNLEAAYVGEKYNLFLTADLGRPDNSSLNREQGFAATPSLVLGDTYKVGASYFYGNGPSNTRNVIGPWGLLGFTHHFYLLSETDFQQQSSKTGATPSTWGAVNYEKLDYEIVQGVHAYLMQDFSQLDFTNITTLHNAYGFGAQWFPRPHFEIDLEWDLLRDESVSPLYGDFAFIMLNFYL